MKRVITSILLAGVWVSVSEFIRNEIFLKNHWVDHYASMGLVFNTTSINGIWWVIWSFLMAYGMYVLLKYLPFKKTIWITWLFSFVMMWITLYNLQILPLSILVIAIPLSIIEVLFAGFILKTINKK